MQKARPTEPIEARVVAVTVTYNPDMEVLQRQQRSLPSGSIRVLVDNASSPNLCIELAAWAAGQQNTVLVKNSKNQGLAAALNQGVRAAKQHAPTATHVLLLDQDSEPAEGSIERLLGAFDLLEHSGCRVGAVGPALLDPVTRMHHGFHQADGWRWRRIHAAADGSPAIACTNLNGSGTLVPIDLYIELGGLEEAFFIDHVDTEWAFRLLSRGYSLWGIPSAEFVHRMGDESRRIWLFGWRVWPLRSPQRHFYLFRNAVQLIRRPYVPLVWKSWAVVKLGLTAAVFGIWGPLRIEQLAQMVRGVTAGMRRTKEA